MNTADPDLVTMLTAGTADDADTDLRELLTSVVGIARDIFAAAASSILLLTDDGAELVFEAVAGAGADSLVGSRFPADRGIAGWVAATGEPMIVDDVRTSVAFAADVAASSGYIPQVIMAVAVGHRGQVLGVLEVLDPAPGTRSNLADLDLLTRFAEQAGLVLHNLRRRRTVHSALRRGDVDYSRLAAVVDAFEHLDPGRRDAGFAIFDAVRALLTT